MRLEFLNRQREIARLKSAIGGAEPALVVIYGRRRCGKSTLLQQVVGVNDHPYGATS
ncbi:ATP-binding protein [Desulfurivibrio alkaliphilus]|uniref:ATP-binding protein n=1 Tax=Desulfurivibrio alkaliphilus TaxID=427923 RepID=UPI0003103717|nr:ATP-binding protein [Desulfurivibrio alkaliphilus]